MSYLIFSAIAAIFIILILLQINKRNGRKLLNTIRANWGKPKTGYFHFERIEKFFEFVPDRSFHQLSDQTIFDIDFYNIFTFIDRTTSKVGQQYLFKKLMSPSNAIEELKRFDATVNFFTANEALREEIQIELTKLGHSDAYSLSSLFRNKLMVNPPRYGLLIIRVFLLIALLALSLKFPVLLICALSLVVINTIQHYWNKNNIFQFSRSLPQLNVLMTIAKIIHKKDAFLKDASVEKSELELRKLRYPMALLRLGNNGGAIDDLSGIFSYFIELINGAFLIEIFTIHHVTKVLEKNKEHILSLFNYIGNIDTAIAVASLRHGVKNVCTPNFTDEKKELFVQNIYHPLIANCATNNLSINGKSILITGSNMSGKTTFLRTLIINSILAQSIYTCFADKFTTPLLKQFSSIRIDDNLMEAKSYFLEEVTIVSSLINEVSSPDQNIFFLDEVFKGTNTVERIASAKAILSYLNRHNNMVIVSTHDVELADMLRDEYDLYHFTETIQQDQLHFDHKLKAGPLKTRNAIKILELSDFPADIIDEANNISGKRSQ
ncbi:MAG TPA: hypothetical protein VG676_03920, partial [Chitinophagaceae bacterium]|nr:hypothetical protein [Chitinophagaceae bacterium]